MRACKSTSVFQCPFLFQNYIHCVWVCVCVYVHVHWAHFNWLLHSSLAFLFSDLIIYLFIYFFFPIHSCFSLYFYFLLVLFASAYSSSSFVLLVGLFVRSWVRYFSIMLENVFVFCLFIYFVSNIQMHTHTTMVIFCCCYFLLFFNFLLPYSSRTCKFSLIYSFFVSLIHRVCFMCKTISKANLSYQTQHQQHSALRHVRYTIQSRPY